MEYYIRSSDNLDRLGRYGRDLFLLSFVTVALFEEWYVLAESILLICFLASKNSSVHGSTCTINFHNPAILYQDRSDNLNGLS